MESIAKMLRKDGYAVVPASGMEDWLKWSWSDWAQFAASWNDLGEDQYMADGGRYRRRRYAVFRATSNSIERAPHQPHFQTKVYNRLNGGLERWFEPVVPHIANHPIVQSLIRRLTLLFGTMLQDCEVDTAWHVEMHQFRISAHGGNVGHPTPEGIHRDGVDAAFVMLVHRENVSSGVTQIYDTAGTSLGSFTLSDPGDAVFLDDARVFHGVTPIAPLNPALTAIRDVLVITFTKEPQLPAG
ncbi:MAG TPA: 2OG-Fe dioxygenase family protein [Rhizomicrobium sp.]|jgi:hypothetical protein